MLKPVPSQPGADPSIDGQVTSRPDYCARVKAARKQATESPRGTEGDDMAAQTRQDASTGPSGGVDAKAVAGAVRDAAAGDLAPARPRRGRRAHLGRVGPRRLPGPPRHRRPPVDGDPVGPHVPAGHAGPGAGLVAAAPTPATSGTGAGHQRAKPHAPRVPPAAGTNLAERMITDMPALPRLLGDFGSLHASLHALPVRSCRSPETGSGGAATAESPLDDDAAPAVVRQREWLDANRPLPGVPAVCHGEFNPAHVVRDGDDGPGVPVNWTAATVAEAEYDVAATLVGFWSTALYGNAVQRRMLKTVRDPLATTTYPLPGGGGHGARRRPAALLAGRTCTAWRRLSTAAAPGRHRAVDTSAHAAIPTCSLRDVDRQFRQVAASKRSTAYAVDRQVDTCLSCRCRGRRVQGARRSDEKAILDELIDRNGQTLFEICSCWR